MVLAICIGLPYSIYIYLKTPKPNTASGSISRYWLERDLRTSDNKILLKSLEQPPPPPYLPPPPEYAVKDLNLPKFPISASLEPPSPTKTRLRSL